VSAIRCKNVSGSPGDNRPPPSCPPGDRKGKAVKKVSKKRKRGDRDMEIARAVAEAAERAEEGGRAGSPRISEQLTTSEGSTRAA
jgi:hypothetical protein